MIFAGRAWLIGAVVAHCKKIFWNLLFIKHDFAIMLGIAGSSVAGMVYEVDAHFSDSHWIWDRLNEGIYDSESLWLN